MYLDPPLSAGKEAGRVTLIFVAVALSVGLAPAGEVLTPVRVVGESGFHHAGSLSEIVMLSDGERFLSSARDGTARLWDLKSGEELRRFIRDDANDVWGIVVLPGEKEILTAGGGGFVTRWELATGREVMSYKHTGTVFRIALRPGGKEFVATDNKNLAVLWNLETGKKVRTFRGHTDSVYTAMFISDGKRLLTGASDGKLKVWDVESGKCERTYEKDLGDVFTIRPSPDGSQFAMCSGDDKLRLFESETLKLLWKSEFEDDLNVVCWSPDGTRLATACEDKFLYVFNAESGKELKKIAVPHGYHTPISFTSDGKELISGGDNMLYRHKAASGKRIVPPAGDPKLRFGVETVALSRSGDLVYAVGSDKVIQVWDTAGGKVVKSFEVQTTIETMVVSPNGELLATGGQGGAVRLRSTKTGAVVRELPAEGSIEQVTFAKSGAWVIAGGADEKVHLWETATGKKLRSFEGHTNDINSVAVSRDSMILVTASDDKTARMWELETGKQLRSFSAVDDNLYGAVVLGDGRSFLITANEPELWGWLAPVVVAEGNLSREEIEILIAELVAEKYSERDAATKTLIARGTKILPLLEQIKPDDPEAAFRLKRIKSKIRTGQLEGELETLHEFKEDVTAFAGDPLGRYWAAIVGRESNARVVIGEVRNRKLHVLQQLSDGHSPKTLTFSGNGTMLATGNRNGTVSLFRVDGGE